MIITKASERVPRYIGRTTVKKNWKSIPRSRPQGPPSPGGKGLQRNNTPPSLHPLSLSQGRGANTVTLAKTRVLGVTQLERPSFMDSATWWISFKSPRHYHGSNDHVDSEQVYTMWKSDDSRMSLCQGEIWETREGTRKHVHREEIEKWRVVKRNGTSREKGDTSNRI